MHGSAFQIDTSIIPRPAQYAGMWEDLMKNSQAVLEFTRQFSARVPSFFFENAYKCDERL